MKRRAFIKALTAIAMGSCWAPSKVIAEITGSTATGIPDNYDNYIKDYLCKIQNFNNTHPDDIYLDKQNFGQLKSSLQRLKRLQYTVGHGNFHLLTFDEAIKTARNYSRVGDFTRKEQDFLEMIFYADAACYGFLGSKPLKKLTDSIDKHSVVKIAYSGNYLYKGEPLEVYRRIRGELGRDLVLTSGVRSIIKQFLLFLDKALQNGGNLSLASRSLAPPGYSFHSIGDFDVGQVGFGAGNFTERFITTPVYKKLKALGYLTLRYPNKNFLGVRYEPWHIKVSPIA